MKDEDTKFGSLMADGFQLSIHADALNPMLGMRIIPAGSSVDLDVGDFLVEALAQSVENFVAD